MPYINWREVFEWLPSCPPGKAKDQLLKHAMTKAKFGKKKAKIRTPRGVKIKTPQAVKKDLKKELEALCKAIVFTRDCGSPEAREGSCISCGQWRVLQWGHFIRQQDSKWLQYDPRNTAGQCAQCNGFGAGQVLKYAEAIDKRDGEGKAKALQREADLYQYWRPNKGSLAQKLKELMQHPLAPKTSEASAVNEVNRPDPSSPNSSPPSSPVSPTPK